MNREEILERSRKEHKNRDLAEMEVVYKASVHAARVGALMCCVLSLLSSVLARTMIYSPWVIYFSIITTQWLGAGGDIFRACGFGACRIYRPSFGGAGMNEELKLKNRLKEARAEANLSQAQLAEMVGVSRNTISSIETEQFSPTAKLALILCIALNKKFEELFYFEGD